MPANKSLKNYIDGKWQLGKDSFLELYTVKAITRLSFFTQTKVIIERWPNDWTRKF